MKKVKLLWMPLHSVVMSIICLASVSWAWFTDQAENKGNAIDMATYGMSIEVSGNGAYEVVQGDTILMKNGRRYDIRIRAEGTAQRGFCIVSAGDSVYHTIQLVPEDMKEQWMEFTVCFPGEGDREVTFIPHWGLYTEEISAGDEISGGCAISAGDVSSGEAVPGKR